MINLPHKQHRILVVDDTLELRRLLTVRLSLLGYQADAAENGQRALDMLRTAAYDLVLLDIMMPVMDGYATLEAIKADEVLRAIPVIVISAVSDLDSVVRCVELGAEDYLIKPYNNVLLRARVTASLERKRLHDQEQAMLEIVRHERARAENLLLNILPAPIAERLKANETNIAELFVNRLRFYLPILSVLPNFPRGCQRAIWWHCSTAFLPVLMKLPRTINWKKSKPLAMPTCLPQVYRCPLPTMPSGLLVQQLK